MATFLLELQRHIFHLSPCCFALLWLNFWPFVPIASVVGHICLQAGTVNVSFICKLLFTVWLFRWTDSCDWYDPIYPLPRRYPTRGGLMVVGNARIIYILVDTCPYFLELPLTGTWSRGQASIGVACPAVACLHDMDTYASKARSSFSRCLDISQTLSVQSLMLGADRLADMTCRPRNSLKLSFHRPLQVIHLFRAIILFFFGRLLWPESFSFITLVASSSQYVVDAALLGPRVGSTWCLFGPTCWHFFVASIPDMPVTSLREAPLTVTPWVCPITCSQ